MKKKSISHSTSENASTPNAFASGALQLRRLSRAGRFNALTRRSHLRVLFGLFVMLAGVLLALVSFGPATTGFAQGTTREQMTLTLAKALDISQPPACVAGQEMFNDVPASSPFCPFIEELARRGVTGGCGGGSYCPGDSVTRQQMAVFIFKATAAEPAQACPTLDPKDEMARVGGVCIDKYEASIWDAPVGGHQITGAIPCNANGQDCTNIYARSVKGVQPRRNISWFQAQAALANSGKRLPTNAEWQMAVRGTPDGFPCNVSSGGPVATGSLPNCVSAFGAFDMVGNVWEWVADWVPLSTACPGWGGFSDDVMCFSGASTVALGPGALVRGGAWDTGTNGGPFAVYGGYYPTDPDIGVGLRGAR